MSFELRDSLNEALTRLANAHAERLELANDAAKEAARRSAEARAERPR